MPNKLPSLFLVLLLISALPAQTIDALLSGAVTDASGAAIVGAEVSAENIKTGVVTKASTNDSGVYLFAALQPGVYRVTASHAGFRKTVLNDITLDVGARQSVNLRMEIGQLADAIEVTADAENALTYATSSVGGVITSQKVLQLPLPDRNVLGLALTQAGVSGNNFSGARIGTLNISLDGINVQDQRINSGVASPIFASTDRVQEFRIVTSPADAELGRGSGQIQMTTRSGTNTFAGSLFHFHRNTVLNANTWFNNQAGTDPLTGDAVAPRNNLIRNQFGGRIGGPIVKNRTFFHFLYEGQRVRQRTATTATVYTADARRGIYRFFPGVRNANAAAAAPTVDFSGNPTPPNSSAQLQSVNLFSRDPLRTAMDPTGQIQRMIDLMPLPNNFRTGDGLNTAGYTWSRRSTSDFNQFTVKLDHNLSDAHRLTFSWNFEDGKNQNSNLPSPLPNSPGGDSTSRDQLYSFTVTSTLRPNLLNEFRAGALRPRLQFRAPWEVFGNESLPSRGGQPYLLDFATVTDPIRADNDPQGRISPVYQYSDIVSWLKGKHAFRGGVDVKFVSTNGYNAFDTTARAVLGQGGIPVQNIANIAGIGVNATGATNILNELSGSLSNARQAFNSPGGANPVFLPGEAKQRTWKQRELAFFFKDDYKVTPNLTLNLGVRWEYYSVPWDSNGRAVAPIGGAAGMFGISGADFSAMFRPGLQNGSLTRVQQVGRNSPNPDTQLYNDDWNNFAPAVGITWGLPWFGKDRTVIRAGYSMGYERNSLRNIDTVAGDAPGLNVTGLDQRASYFNLAALNVPLPPPGAPLQLVPLDERAQSLPGYETGLRTPYVQNWNFSIQRQIVKDFTLDLRYVGNKGTKLLRASNVNEANIFENGILEAFNITRAGGHSPLLDRIFMGLNIPGVGVVDGVRITGSDAMRGVSTLQGYLANNQVGTFANYLNTNTAFTGQRGGLIRRAGLPENFISVNPQYSSSDLLGNYANSSWHSFQIEVNKRFSNGWTLLSNYTWSKALGEEDGDGQSLLDSYRTNRNRQLDKRLLDFDLRHVFRNSGTYELPFGKNKKFLGSAPKWIDWAAGGWQVGGIFNMFSGSPFTLTNAVATFNTTTDNTATATRPIDPHLGEVAMTGGGPVYFNGYTTVPDPSRASIASALIRNQSVLFAVQDAQGNIIAVNPVAGTLGNLNPRRFSGPGSFRLDLNLMKRVSITERYNLELRADATDVTNSPQWNNPTTNINSADFGRITGAGGNRIVVVSLRLNF